MPAPQERSLTLRVEYPARRDLIHDYRENICNGETFVLTDRELPAGEQVEIELSCPDLLRPIRLSGRVRWARPGPAGDRGLGVGFDLGGAVGEGLASLIERIEGGDPQIVMRSVRILLVEDNPHVAHLLEDGFALGQDRYTQKVRFIFDHVTDGVQALERLRVARYDLVITDVYLPTMDGPTLVRAIRADPGWGHLPILGVSAGGKGASDAVLAAGANIFVEKPMRLADVLSGVRQLLELQEETK